MNILVTGASGLVASHLIPALLKAGHHVRTLGRDSTLGSWSSRLGDRQQSWKQVSDALSGCDAVIHLAGAGIADKPWTDERKKEILESRTLTTRELVDACKSLDSGRRPNTLISASAIGFYGDRGDEELSERSLGDPSSFSGQVCHSWEAEAREAQSLGVRVVLARIGVVLSPAGGALEKMRLPFEAGAGATLGDGNQWMSWIHVDDLVAALIRCLTHPQIEGPINCTSPEPVTNKVFTRTLANAVGTRAALSVPRVALRLGLGEMSEILLTSQRVLPIALEQQHGFSFKYGTLSSALADVAKRGVRTLIRYQRVSQRPEQVFEFFSDARNLEAITPSTLSFKILGTPPRTIREGSRIEYQLKVHGVPIHWETLIESWKENVSFVDFQLKGPYSLWRHEHTFEPLPQGGTLLGDKVEYKLPLGPLGSGAAGWFVAQDVAKIFDYRQKVIEERFCKSS